MGAVCVLTPVLIAAWPSVLSLVGSAAASLGYAILTDGKGASTQDKAQPNELTEPVRLEISDSEIVCENLERAQSLTVSREGITITFSRDERGRLALCVAGSNYTREQLQILGNQMRDRVMQTFVQQKLKKELQARNFIVVDERTDSQEAIHLKVRLWEP